MVAVISSAAEATMPTLVDASSMAAATLFMLVLISSEAAATVLALSEVWPAPADIWSDMAFNSEEASFTWRAFSATDPNDTLNIFNEHIEPLGHFTHFVVAFNDSRRVRSPSPWRCP
jgi:hypothetical protein